MSLRSIITLIIFGSTFFGLMSMVGNVHVVEFYGILTISIITSLIGWFKLGRLGIANKKYLAKLFNPNQTKELRTDERM